MFEKMKPFLIIILVISPLVLCEETVDDLVQLFDDSKILSEFVKRLSAGHADTSDRPNAEHKSPTCKHQAFPKTIIATKASTSAGATFLDSEDGLGSNEECVQRCCEMDGCELAVYENKDKRNCYLFTCKDKTTGENLCHFANHDDYVSTSVTHSIHKQLAHSSTSEHENDLQDLSDVDKKPRPTTTTTTTTTTQKPTTRKTTTTTTTTEKPEVPHSVKLGEACRSINGCEDSHAICSSGTCSCKNLYYNKRGTCREVCGHSRFECQVVDLDGPDCIRLSLVCDGIKDCHDGSDELNCQTEAPIPHFPWNDKISGFGPNFAANLHQAVVGKDEPEDNANPTLVVPVPDAAGLNREYHDHQTSKQSSHTEELQSKKLDTDIQNIKASNTKSSSQPVSDHHSKPSSSKKEDPVHVYPTAKHSNVEKSIAPSPTQRPKPIVVWPDGSYDDDDFAATHNDHETPQQIESHPDDKGSPSKEAPHHYEQIENYVPDTKFSFQGKKGPSYFVANEKPSDSNEAKKTDVKIINKPKVVPIQKPKQQPMHDSHMITNTKSSSEEDMDKRPIQSQILDRNYRPNIGNNQFYQGYGGQPPYRPEYPSDLNMANTETGPRDITPYNRMYQQNRQQSQAYPPRLGYQNPPMGPNPYQDSYNKNYMYDLPDYEAYQPDDSSQEHPFLPENGKKTGAQSSSISGGLKAHQTGDNTHPDITSSKKKIIHHEDNKSEEHKSSTEEKSEAKSTTDIKSNSTSDGKKPTANNKNTDNNKADTEGKTKQGGEGTSKVTTVEVDEEQSFIVTKEKVIVASPTSQAQGPIVALSLGLAFTFLLLVFLACRMRNIKRRLRKGRVLHSNEADYLINGMYL